MSNVHLYVLAGGTSSRFGQDKARAVLDGMPLVARVAAMLGPATVSTTVVADVAGKYGDLGLRTIADLSAGLGPIGGLDAALADRGEGHLLLAACDLVTARPEWIKPLQRAAGAEGSAAFRSPSGWEPLLAWYHTSLSEVVTMRTAGKDRSLQSLLDACGAEAVDLPADWPELNQVNTPEEYRRVGGQPPI